MTYKHTTKLTPQQRAAWAQARAAQKRTIARNKVTPSNTALSARTKQIQNTNAVLRGAETVGDLTADVLTGALKALEGVYDLGAGIVGAVGGIFSKDFQDDVKDHIAYDAMGTWVGDPLDSLFDDSYLNDSKAGQITEAVAQGVGQMLPAVAATIITHGATSKHLAAQGASTAAQIAAASKAGQVAALATTAASAAGTGTEEAFQEGAGYGKGLAYGALTGAVEAGTEKLTGGLTKGLYGGGVLDKIGKSVAKESAEGAVKAGAKVGAQRVIKGMVEEGAEEAIAELASPTLKSIYKGKDAFKEYGEGEYWGGVGEAALVGGLTSAVYGGTVGKIRKLGGASGIENDAKEISDDIEYQTERLRKLEEKGTLTPEREAHIKKVIKADVELLSKQLQKTSADKRAKVLSDSPVFASMFSSDGTVKAEAIERMDNAIKSASDTSHGLDHRYYSETARGRESEIIDGLAAQGTKVVSGELTAEESKAYAEVRKAHNKLRALGFVDTDLVLAESMTNDNAYLDGKTVVIGRDTLTNGQYIKSLIHETTHFTEGTQEWVDVTNYVFGKDGSSVSSLIERVKTSGYGVTQDDVDTVLAAVKDGKLSDTDFTEAQRTLVYEVVAMKMEETFSDERSVERLVNDNPSLAKRVWERIKALVESFGKSKEEREELKKLRQTEQLFRRALENAGLDYLDGEMKKSADDTEENNLRTIKFSRMNNKSFEENVDSILVMSDKEAKLNAEEGNFIRILPNTPSIILDNIKNASDLEVIIRFDALYLAARNSGILPGHYHALGNLTKKLPDFITAPDAILRMRNGRLNIFTSVSTKKGKNGIISVELNTVKDINSNYNKYNLVISVFSAADNYTRNNIQKNGVKVEYEKEDLSQVNPQLYEWLAIINEKSSMNSIPQTEEKSTISEKKVSDNIHHSHKASADSDRITVTKGSLAKLKANYEGEKVFNKKDISAALEKIDALKVLSKSERDSLISKLFEGYNIRLDAEHYEQFSEIMYNKIRARILQESDFELSVEETSIMDEQIVKALNDIVASGKQSTRAKLEYSVSQDGLKKQADYWRSEYNRASEQIKIRGRILSIAHKIKDLKTGAYVNAAQYKSDIFKHSIEQLGRIEFRGNMNNAGTRAIIKNLNEWYDDKNNSLYKGADANTGTVGRFNNEIKQMMSAIADGDGAFTTEELLTIEKILSYFVGEIQDYNTILRNGKRVDAKPIAERHIKTAEEAQALKIKCGAIRAISRSPFAVMVADPATLMRQADGYMNGFFTEMFDEMRQGEIKAAVAEMELTNEYREFWKKNKAYAKRYNKDTVKVNGVDIPLRHAISLYMTYQRKQAQAGLIYSGFDILDGDKKITVYKGTDEKLNEKQIADISKKRAKELKAQFNEKDLELVSVMESAFEECRKLKIDVDMALQHYTNVDKSGYYFPIRRSQIAQNIDMFSIFEGDRVSNLSMNKDLVKGAKNALLIEPVDIVFMRHIKATSLYSGLGVFTDNFNRLYNLNVNAVEKELSFEVENDVKKSFGFNSINDYVGVQKAVISTLSSEGFFDNNVIVNKDSGMEIEITKDGIKETLGSDMRFEKLPRKLKELKLLTLRVLPMVIEKAKLTDSDVNNIHSEQSELKYSYLTQDITISNGTHQEKYTITVAIRRSRQKNKFWIHEIRTTKKGAEPIPSDALRHDQGQNEVRTPYSIISLDGEFVNSKFENSDYNRPKTIKSTLESDKFTKAMAEYFTEIKKDIEGISTKEQSTKFFNDAVGYIRSAYAKYQLGANPKVWFTQLSSFFAATNIIDHNSIIKGLGVKNKASDVDKYCKLAWLRNVDNTAVKAQSVTDKIGKVGDVLTAPIGWMDRGVVTSLFGACQIQVQKDQKLAVGTEENKRAAGELLQKVILETQQNSLASERSAMMRSSDNLKKSFTMFSADSMKIFSRTVDAFGEREVLRTLIKNETDTKKKAEYEARLKKVNKACVRSVSALVTTSIFVAAIARGFKWWYRRDDEEDAWTFISDVFGNMLGGLPVIRDVYSYFADGYEMDNFLISTFNDVLKASLETWELASDVINGKDVSQQEIAGSVRKMLYASGQVLGIPTRNIYNFTTGNINRFFPATGYEIENMFYKQAYRADLAKAIEKGDERMISTIAGLMLNENVGGIESKAARTELDRLIGAGFDVLPRGVSDTITYDGETYELTARQKKAFSEVYEIANDALGDMVKLARYNEASDEVKVSAIKYIYNTYYNLALQDFLGEDLESKNVLFAEAIDIEKLALIIATVRSLKADTDKDGKTIGGSRKRKIQAYINSLQLKAAEKYMIMGYLGFKNINGEAQVKAHINTLNLTKQEKSRLLEYSGYSAA